MNYRRARRQKTIENQKVAAQEKAKEIQEGGGAGMKKELKALKCKGYFKKSRAQRNARSS